MINRIESSVHAHQDINKYENARTIGIEYRIKTNHTHKVPPLVVPKAAPPVDPAAGAARPGMDCWSKRNTKKKKKKKKKNRRTIAITKINGAKFHVVDVWGNANEQIRGKLLGKMEATKLQ
jgi:hypothetical protein